MSVDMKIGGVYRTKTGELWVCIPESMYGSNKASGNKPYVVRRLDENHLILRNWNIVSSKGHCSDQNLEYNLISCAGDYDFHTKEIRWNTGVPLQKSRQTIVLYDYDELDVDAKQEAHEWFHEYLAINSFEDSEGIKDILEAKYAKNGVPVIRWNEMVGDQQ